MDQNFLVNDLEIMAGARHYNEWIYSRIRPHLGKRILELGAGIGNFTERFLDSERLIVLEIEEGCYQKLLERFGKHDGIAFVQSEMRELLQQGYFREEKIDTVVCLNVLEHIEDDCGALRDVYDILVPGGKLILMVPCFQSLYGEMDRLLGHYRRYKSRELTEKVKQAGFQISKMFYMNSVGMFGWFLNSRILNKTTQSAQQVRFYDRFVVPVVSRIESVIKPPFGQSLFAICIKP